MCKFAADFINILMSVHVQNTRMTTAKLRQMKQNGEKIAMLTSYDYTLARLVDEAGIDMLLVGDSGSNVVCGTQYTLPITVDEMIFLAKGVVRAAQHALVVCDMPFGSYQISEEDALRNAVKMMKESGCDALKLEGGEEILPVIKHMIQAGIPVMGHLGLTPQSVNQFGGYGLRAKEQAEAEKLLHDAKLLDQAGCFSIVLEKIPAALAQEVTKAVSCPVIGIGAGNGCDGQVLVLHDMLGLNQGFKPKFLRHFAQLGETVKNAVGEYITAVKDSTFPNSEESY
jgi:3-methyl-2-oxobutanoate hydroxymethyltransferase